MLSPRASKHSSLISETIDRFILDGYVVQTKAVDHQCFVFQDVKVSPATMEFHNAFEGKKYYQKLTIQNCGLDRAFIRICAASSYAFEIKPLVRGKYLSPGLSLVRYISYTYMRATAVPLAWVPIHINGVQCDYKLVVSLSRVMISAIPQQIDFGIIDAGYSAAVRMLSLRNDGSKATRFAIDLGRNEIELIVEPTKGIIQPRHTVTLRVECLGTTEGEFSREFWIKCDTPLRIIVKGKIIIQQLYSIHPNTTQHFTLIDFSKTYFGTQFTRTLVIKNFSAMAAAYCTLAELGNENMNLEEARKQKSDYLNFHITPLEGSLVPHEARIFQFTYSPVKDTSKINRLSYEKTSFCCIRVIRIPCMDISQVVIPENVTAQDQDSACRYMLSDDTLHDTSDIMPLQKSQDEITSTETLALENVVRVLLYGEAESAGVAIRPDALQLCELANNVPVTRELLLINQSSSLPIIFDYKKTCSVNVEPSSGILPPAGKLEVCVIVTPVKIGKVKTKIAFDLLYINRPKESQDCVLVGQAEISLTYDLPSVTTCAKPRFNMGITPTYIKEVGFSTDDVKFNSPIKMPKATLMDDIMKMLNKEDSDLIAFPNDRPKSLRPWKNPNNCRTICAGIPRARSANPDTYELSQSKSDLKQKDYSYYKNYIRQEGERIRALNYVPEIRLSEYDVANKLLKNIPKPKCITIKNNEIQKVPFAFIPLTPLQLNKIMVYPYDIRLGKIAPNSASTIAVTIHNQNDFSIKVFTKSRKPVVEFPSGDHKIVKPRSQVQVPVTYNSGSGTGRFGVIMDFIVNDNHTFVVWITVDVVPKRVKFNSEDIVFESDQSLHKYLDIYNPVNVPIAFQWHVPDSCFVVEPLAATIPPRQHITCLATYTPHHGNLAGAEITLFSENGRNQTVNVVTNFNKPTVSFKHAKIVFDNISLNLSMQGTNTLKNLGYETVTFAVLNPKPMTGISISPTEGLLHGLAEQSFTINIKISACVSFTCTVEIEVQRVKVFKFQISGSVIYPCIEIKPEVLQLRRLVPNSFERQVFVIINKSSVAATIEFPLTDEYSEYKVLETRDFDSRSEPVTQINLGGKEQKELYLYFVPIGAASYRFYLPILINGLLGPAYMNKPETLKISSYIEAREKEYVDKDYAKSIVTPKNLPTLTVSTVVGGDMLRFSKLQLRLKYMPYFESNVERQAFLYIWNASKDTCKFCIRTDELTTPFSITYVKGNEIESLPYSIICVLGPKEDLTLRVEFLPQFPGNYHAKLPIYVRHYLEGNIFNYLTLSGWFPPPTISASEKSICLEPVPLKCETEYGFSFTTKYHPRSCKVSMKTNIPEIRIDFLGETITEETKPTKEVRVLLKCCIKSPTFVDSDVIFSCSCDIECYVNIKACSDNCTITTHPFIQNYTKTLFAQMVSFSAAKSFPAPSPEEDCQYGKCSVDMDSMSTLYSVENASKFNINYNESPFPMFPDEYDQTDYAKHMRKSIIALEEWLYHQGFYGAQYNKIPEGIATTPEPKKSKRDGNGKNDKNDKNKIETFPVLKFVMLLTTLVGPQVSKYIPIRQMPEDDFNRINYIYKVYANAKEFIVLQGGLMPHVTPESLLCYNDYIVFMKIIYPLRPEYLEANAVELMEEEMFYRISKQSWMDMLLQTYKVFVLARVRLPRDLTEIGSNETKLTDKSNTRSSTSIVSQSTSFIPIEHLIKEPESKTSLYNSQQLITNNKISNRNLQILEDIYFWQELSQADPLNSKIFNESERILLHWLQYHFNRQRETLWGPNGLVPTENIPQARYIRFFDVDLSDGLVLIAITAMYCPYLIPYLTDIYVNPTCVEQAFHNASKLVQSWSMIGLSFTLSPKQITSPNGLQMLMLVNYLYEVLPGFYPYNTINFKVGLSQSCTQSVAVDNLSNFQIAYTIIFFKNDRGSFRVPKNVVNLRPRQKMKIQVKYNANRVSMESVVMILNGETPKRNYAKTMAFLLIGEPIPAYSSTTITIPAPIYQLREVTLPIQSPYKGSHTYEIHYAVEEPLDIKTCKIIPWAREKHRNVPKRIISDITQVKFNEEGIGTFDVTICYVSTNEKSIWIVFKNDDVGDFTIKIVTVPELEPKIFITIPVFLPQDFDSVRCSCKSNTEGDKQCPRTIIVPVPCRNELLWNAVTESMMKIVDEKDLLFWQHYLGTNAGIQINKWIAEDPKNETSYDIQEIFDSTVNYKILPENAAYKISFPQTTTIENVHSFDYHEIPVHLNNGRQDFNFTLESERGLELRHYSVNFLSKKEHDSDIQLVNVQ